MADKKIPESNYQAENAYMQQAIEEASRKGLDMTATKNFCRDKLRNFIYEKVGRSPVIMPIFMEC